ncbi:cyclodeaminase/cyclohydrolase family protein, partial [Halobium palmae]
LAAPDEGDSTAVKRATGVPLSIAEVSLEVLERGETVSEAASPAVLPDVGVGVCLAQSAVRASLFTVRANLSHVDDDSFVDDARERAANVEDGVESVFRRVAADLGMER